MQNNGLVYYNLVSTWIGPTPGASNKTKKKHDSFGQYKIKQLWWKSGGVIQIMK
jgi:hypothetical protein